jgi:ubiquinone/menaquinone biosynthesis C-methylase UbiE
MEDNNFMKEDKMMEINEKGFGSNKPAFEYNGIAQEYQEVRTEQARLVSEIFMPAMLERFSKDRPKQVVDLACGTGVYPRLWAKQAGVEKVVGVDISDEMIRLAKERQEQESLGIDYAVYDVAKMPKLGEFDMATAVFLLHYAKTQEELSQMCQSVSDNLKPGGKFVFINSNPEHPTLEDAKYGTTRNWETENHSEGAVIKVSFHGKDSATVPVDTYFWNKETYEQALTAAGLMVTDWSEAVPAGEVDSMFWEEYQRAPAYVVVECVKVKRSV